MRGKTLLVASVAVALGIAAEWALYGWNAPGRWVPDLATGWIFIACGLVASHWKPKSHIGALMTLTGGLWFLGNFSPTLSYLHRGPLAHLVLTYPSGRTRGRLETAGVAVFYCAALVWPAWHSETVTIALCLLLVVLAARNVAVSFGRERVERRAAFGATAALVLLLITIATIRLMVPTDAARDATLLGYQLGSSALSLALLGALLLQPWDRLPLKDLVVELSDRPSGSVGDVLARTVGDPSLQIGFWLAERQGYVDADGLALTLPVATSTRAVMKLDTEGQPVAVLVHDAAILVEVEVAKAVRQAAQLAASNARLQAEVGAQIEDLASSRRRLVRAGDEERQRLEERLHVGAERRLRVLNEILARVTQRGNDSAVIERAQGQAELALVELRELGIGLHPRVLTERGLGGALAKLAEESSVPVELTVSTANLPPELAATVYFICSEALANVLKYASASRVQIVVTAQAARLGLVVDDDGTGGADPRDGTGLRGLQDRVEALGGTLTVESPSGIGTRLTADLPLATS